MAELENETNIKKNEKIYETTWFTIIMLILFLPYGVILMWVNKNFSILSRKIITVISIPVILVGFLIFLALITPRSSSVDSQPKKITQADYKSYETGISYENLARTPDKYKGEKVKFNGKVLQVINDSDNKETQLRLAVDDKYDDVLYLNYKNTITDVRILENDYVMIRGISKGIIDYKSTMGGKISIPCVNVDEISLVNKDKK